MAWTSPRTYTTGELITASILNTHVRDNLNETAPAKVTTAGDILVGTGANALKRLAKGSATDILRVNAAGTDIEFSNVLTSHIGLTNTAHSATSAATVSTIMARDASGRSKVIAPSAADDIARKDTVDAVMSRFVMEY